jgi:predicted ABC-type ATPase
MSAVSPDPRSSEDRWALVLAGPNGAGKTTLAQGILPVDALYFKPMWLSQSFDVPVASVDIAAARLVLASLRQAVRDGRSFCIETNLAGPGLQRHIADGYQVQLVFVWRNSVDLALQRVAARVERGGHNVPPDVVATAPAWRRSTSTSRRPRMAAVRQRRR